MVDFNKLTKEQLVQAMQEQNAKIEVLTAQVQAPTGRFIVKYNSKGGLYIAHPSFQSWSTAKSKQYTANINLPIGVGEALFSSPELFKEISEAMASLPRPTVLNNIR